MEREPGRDNKTRKATEARRRENLDTNNGLGLYILDLHNTGISHQPFKRSTGKGSSTHLLCRQDITHRLHLDRLTQQRRSRGSSGCGARDVRGSRDERISILGLLIVRNTSSRRRPGLVLLAEFHELTDSGRDSSVDLWMGRGRGRWFLWRR